ncbi:MAG: multidrug efflux system membrane fusion protein [Oleiphilaceae bacterium]|jgi:multidrug efflux system membrane fusion protein
MLFTFHRLLRGRMNRSLILSISLAALALVWILSGSLSSNSEEEGSVSQQASELDESGKSSPRFKVKVEAIDAKLMLDRIDLQGEIESVRDIEVRAETDGIVTKLKSNKGEHLTKGQQILVLATNDRQARLARAKAELKVRQADLKSSLSLKAKKLISENQYLQNVANVVSAEAEVKEREIEIQRTTITAAFDGVLDELHVELGDYVSSGTALATLVDDQYITISAEVPQQHISKLKNGQKVSAELLNGAKIEGELFYISSSADTRTRTFRIEAKALNTMGIKRFGQSARVSIYLDEQYAHKLSPSLLGLDSDGLLEIKGVDEGQRVITHTVDILRSENDGIWLSGLPKQFNLITVGQGFVSEGDVVNAIFNTPAIDDAEHGAAL